MKTLTFALILLGLVSKPDNVGVGFAVTYLPPVLEPIGGVARMNYAGICQGQDRVLMPSVYADPAPQGSTGIAAVRQIFRNDPQVAVTEDQSEIITITVGRFSKSSLQTRLPVLTLDSEAQYDPYVALKRIEAQLNAYAVEHGLHFGRGASSFDHVAGQPVAGAPHLPPLMQNVTIDDALDSVARTFKVIVLYGTCSQSDGKELFRISY